MNRQEPDRTSAIARLIHHKGFECTVMLAVLASTIYIGASAGCGKQGFMGYISAIPREFHVGITKTMFRNYAPRFAKGSGCFGFFRTAGGYFSAVL